MLKSVSVRVPICVIGHSLVQHNYPVLCYFSDENRVSLALSQGIGRIKVEDQSPLANYLEKVLSKALSPHLSALGFDVYVKGSKALPLMDSLIVILHTVLKEIEREDLLTSLLLRKLKISSERARIVLETTSARGVVAYRKGEGFMELTEDFPWAIGLCFKTPFRFKLSEFGGFEESFNAVIHALGRLIIVVARSIIDCDFELFRKALTKYSKLSLVISDLPLTVLRAYEKLSKIKEVSCKIDEDFRGFMLFSEREEMLNECLNTVGRMGFKVVTLRS